jgi:CRP-like cAMP-binding protein
MATAEATKTALARSSILGHLSAAGLSRLVERGLEISLLAGAQLFSRGDEGDALYVILEGEIEVSLLTATGKGLRLASLPAGEVVGEMAVLDGLPRSATATALRRSRLVKLGREAVQEALLAEPNALMALVQALAARVRQTNEELEAATGLSLKGRLARLLVLESSDGGHLVQLTQTEIARRMSASREKVNRALHGLRNEGLIELSKAGVKILRLEALQDVADPAQDSP